ncbi:MAG: HAMP domain-containing sensor histidine kinase, partial [Myxococcota bacterium]
GIAFSAFVLVAVHSPPKKPALFVVSVTVDAVAAFCSLLPFTLWPEPQYAGILSVPDTTGVYVAVIAAGFRLSPFASVWGGLLNLAGVLVLTAIDRVVSIERFAVGADKVSMFAIFIVAFGMLSFIIATSTRRLVLRGAVAAIRSDRAEQGLGAVMADHHDLRSLLTSVTINADRLVGALPPDDAATERLRALAHNVADDLRRIGKIFQSIKSRAQAGNAGLGAREPVAVGEVAARAAAQISSRFADVRVEVAIPIPGPRVLVSGGEPTLHRLLVNLLCNACEGRGDEHATRVEVRVSDAALGMLRIHVADDGPGYSSEQLTRRHSRASDKPGGAGIGLTVVRGLAECSGGSLRLVNRPEGGALATVTLPAAATTSA